MILDEKVVSGSDNEHAPESIQFRGLNRLDGIEEDGIEVDADRNDSVAPKKAMSLTSLARHALDRLFQKQEETFAPEKARVAMDAARVMFADRFDHYIEQGGREEIQEYLKQRIEERFPEKPRFRIDVFLAELREDMCDAFMNGLGIKIVKKTVAKGRLDIDDKIVSKRLVRLLPDVLKIKTERLLETMM